MSTVEDMQRMARAAVEVRMWKPTDDDTLQRWSSIIGIVTAIVGNVLIALALNVQRYAHTRLHKERVRIRKQARMILKRQQTNGGRAAHNGGYGATGRDSNGHNSSRDDSRAMGQINSESSLPLETDPEIDTEDAKGEASQSSSYLKSPYWWLGQILITLGEMGNFLAYGFAPASIVSPLGVVALVSNCIIAPVMFKERFRMRDFWGVVIAVLGVVTVVFSAKQEETKLNPSDIIKAITTLEFKIYFAVTVTLIFVLMWASRRYGRHTILIDLGLVGLFGGYTVLATKGVSSMLSSTFLRAFTTPITYVLLVILLGTAILQIRYVNKALQRFDSTQVIPIQFVMFTLCVILGSAVLYRDFEKTTPQQAQKFVGGCLLTFFGVFLITSGRQHKSDDEDMLVDELGIEETIGLMDQDGNPTQVEGDVVSVSRSRRSSKLSKVSFVDHGPRSPETPIIKYQSAGSTGSSFTEEFIPSSDVLSSSAPQTGSPALDTLLTPVTTDVNRSVPPTPLGEQVGGTSYSERPVTPRLQTTGNIKYNHGRPFISPSPLSSTVTAVVKDAFLRENEASLASQSSLRRIRSSIRASLYFDDDADIFDGEPDTQQTLVPNSELHLPLYRDEESAPEGDIQRLRSRSLSETLVELFRPKKRADRGSTAGLDE